MSGDERTFEELQRELDEIVQRLERGDVDVDELVPLWHRGDELYRECSRRLEAVELQVEELGDDTRAGSR